MLNCSVAIDDKYALDKSRIYASGVQCLVRLPLMQRALDRAAGLNTAGFISGYRGSPLGVYDSALTAAKKFLEKNDIVFHAGVNEDLAATSIWGTQQTTLFGQAKVDGVFGIWYGKGPGVDRSMDPIKHGNLAGSSKHGGVVALIGDDHGAYSSTQRPSERIRARSGDDPDPQSRRHSGICRVRPLRLRAVALFGLLDGIQGADRDHRTHPHRWSWRRRETSSSRPISRCRRTD